MKLINLLKKKNETSSKAGQVQLGKNMITA